MNILLCIDIGNTTIGFGLYTEPAGTGEPGSRLIGSPRIKKVSTYPQGGTVKYKKVITCLLKEAVPGKAAERFVLKEFLNKYRIKAVVSSVVPSLNKIIRESLVPFCEEEPILVSSRLHQVLSFSVKKPEEVGADRIANAVAGLHYAKGPVAVVDFGTATTITVAGKKQDFLGGAILPGIRLMQKNLHTGTAKLPITPLEQSQSALGKDTRSSIASGILRGTAGAAESLVKDMEKELDFRLQLVLTGGNAPIVSPLIKRRHILIPHLTFEGLRLISMIVRSGNA